MNRHGKKTAAAPKPEPDSELGSETQRLIRMMRKQNSLRYRFFLGIVFGLGSAIGATVIAAVLIIGLSRLLAPVGVDVMSDLQRIRQTLEALETPADSGVPGSVQSIQSPGR